MKLRKVLGSFAWVVLAAALILVNAAAANAQDKACLLYTSIDDAVFFYYCFDQFNSQCYELH